MAKEPTVHLAEEDLTVVDLQMWLERWDSLKVPGKGQEMLAVGRGFRDKYNLTDRRALDYLNRRLP